MQGHHVLAENVGLLEAEVDEEELVEHKTDVGDGERMLNEPAIVAVEGDEKDENKNGGGAEYVSVEVVSNDESIDESNEHD